MDITARIIEVIGNHGLTKKAVAEKMGKFDQGFNSLIKNPKWSVIEEVADAIGISTQELLFGAPAIVEPAAPAAPADDLPFGKEPLTDRKPDLITIDRETGKTLRYALLQDEK